MKSGMHKSSACVVHILILSWVHSFGLLYKIGQA